MTTTLTITSGQASFTAQNYTILPSPGTAVPDNLVNAILQAAQTAGVVLSSSAGVGAVTVASRRFNRSGVGPPQAGEGRWLLGDEVVDSAGSEWENTAPGDPGTWVAAQSGTFASIATTPRMAGPLGGWKAKIATDPTNAKVVILGDSTSDAGTNACMIYRRLLALHSQQGEALSDVGSTDFFTDGVGNGTSTFTSATANFVAGDVGRLLHGKGVAAGCVISAVNSSSSVTLTGGTVASGTALPFWVGRHVISGGNNGRPLLDWTASPSLTFPTMPYSRDRLVADAPDLTIASWLINDVRQGLLGTTVAAIVPAGITRLQAFIDWHRTTLPNTDLLLRMPNSLLTADVGGTHSVTDASANVNPAGLAQIYSTALRRIYLWFVGKYPNVDVIDVQGEVFGTRSTASHPLMQNQLHPSASTSSDLNSITPVGGGYVAIADALAKRIGFTRNAFSPDVAQRARHEFVVYGGSSAGAVRLISRDYNLPAAGAPVFPGDSLYVNGVDGPITVVGVNRVVSPTVLELNGLGSTDFLPYTGNTAVVTGTHPNSTGERVQLFVDLPSIAANTTSTVNVTVTGLSPGNGGQSTAVIASPGSGFAVSALRLKSCFPDATDRVRLDIENPTGSAIDLAGESWTFWIVR